MASETTYGMQRGVKRPKSLLTLLMILLFISALLVYIAIMPIEAIKLVFTGLGLIIIIIIMAIALLTLTRD